MEIRWVRRGVFAFFLLYAAAVTWPGALLFREAEPFLLGLPLSMAWPALWILLGGLALWTLHRTEERHSSGDGGEGGT
jgi:hypothetical protein